MLYLGFLKAAPGSVDARRRLRNVGHRLIFGERGVEVVSG
jgi:hypothetical protein